jgi:CRISPR-associated protein Cas4
MEQVAELLLTIDMVHQFAYCPRRMQLMYVDGRWEDNLFTDQGRSVHARLDAEDDPLPPSAEGDPEPVVARSVSLASETLGLTGKLDLLEVTDGRAVPVETKRAAPPVNPERSYEPERVQLMCQALLLREHGYLCNQGMLYFAASAACPCGFSRNWRREPFS